MTATVMVLKMAIDIQLSVKSDEPFSVKQTEKKKNRWSFINDAEMKKKLFAHIRLLAYSSLSPGFFGTALFNLGTSLFDETRPRMPWHVGPLTICT